MKRTQIQSVVCTLALILVSVTAELKSTSCNEVKAAYRSKGFNLNDVPNQGVHGAHLKVCPQGYTCCTVEMEEKLSERSRSDLKAPVSQQSATLQSSFSQIHRRFDHFFRRLLDKAERSLNDMFVHTYGLMYVNNAELFKQFFKSLQQYYTSGRAAVHLDSVLSDFWADLLERIFKLVNVQHEFSDAYMECVHEHGEELRPFGDVPRKLRLQLPRAFVAARTFTHGLALLPQVVAAVSTVGASPGCVRATMKMLYCPYCSGLVALKPCHNYCLNVMRGCLAHQADLDSEWNNFLAAMLNLAESLEGPFNFESVMHPIDVKISEAIMNVQENSMQVSEKVFQGCGQPQAPIRSNRAIKGESYTGRFRPYTPDARPTTAAGTSLDRLVTEVKKKLKQAKKFWSTLPETVCAGETVAPSDECWNGTAKSRYELAVAGNGLVNQVRNPDVEVDVTRLDPIIGRQIRVLREMTSRLKAAHRGQDISTDQDADEGSSGEESGSGCDSPSCEENRDIYFPTPVPSRPRVVQVVPGVMEPSSTASVAEGRVILVGLALALLAAHWR